MKKIEKMLENGNFLNNQNYILGKVTRVSVYSNYLKLLRKSKVYSVLKEYNSTKFHIIIIAIFPFMLAVLAYIDQFLLWSNWMLWFVLLTFLLLFFPVLFYFFVKLKYLYFDVQLKDIFVTKLINKDSFENVITLNLRTILIRYVFGLVISFLFFMIWVYLQTFNNFTSDVSSQTRILVIFSFFLFPIFVVFIKIENIIPYLTFNILSELEYYIHFSYFFVIKNKAIFLDKEIYINSPIHKDDLEIVSVTNEYLVTKWFIVKFKAPFRK